MTEGPATGLRVALLTREFPPEVYGGAGVHVEHLAEALAPLVDVSVYCFGVPRLSPLVAATYEPWPALAGRAGAGALQPISVDLLMAADVGGADVVHSHTWYTNLGGHLAKQMHAIPHVVTTHSLEPMRPWKRDQLGAGYEVSKFCERTALEGADAVIAVSSGMRDDVLRIYPAIDPVRVTVIYNGVDATEYEPDPGTDALVRHGIDPDRQMVVFVGRITAQKGILELLAAARSLDSSAQLVLCAAAPDNPAIEEAVRAAVSGLRASGRNGVVWIDTALPRDETIQVLSHASVFVCPSQYEPFGLVNIEAMACGAPVVATATGGIPEIVVDGVTGYLVPPGPDFASDLAERINDLLRDPALGRRFGHAGRQRVLDHFTWPAIAAQTADLYRRLVAG
ncbi:MAG: alpha-maltose-phosphate synthase [Acidimicrobiaceae bacterium]|jgi:starch synthase|nr:alpha-maltose-phosphate synthase [Acidimicrobiaceae bacterium]